MLKLMLVDKTEDLSSKGSLLQALNSIQDPCLVSMVPRLLRSGIQALRRHRTAILGPQTDDAMDATSSGRFKDAVCTLFSQLYTSTRQMSVPRRFEVSAALFTIVEDQHLFASASAKWALLFRQSADQSLTVLQSGEPSGLSFIPTD